MYVYEWMNVCEYARRDCILEITWTVLDAGRAVDGYAYSVDIVCGLGRRLHQAARHVAVPCGREELHVHLV
jgi:hypothetical protein